MQKKKASRRNRGAVWLDFGPPERMSRQEVIVIGEGRLRQARVVSVISRFDEREQRAALHILRLADGAKFSGFKCSRLSWETRSSTADEGPDFRAIKARRAIYQIQSKMDRRLWAVIWYVLICDETQACFSVRAGIQRRYVSPMLRCGLASAANIIWP